MSHVSTIARRATRRLLRKRLMRTLPLALTQAIALAAMLVATSRLAGIAIPLWLLIALPCLLALVWTAIAVLGNSPTPLQAASILDERADLHDQLATSLEFSTHSSRDPFELLAQHTGESLASSVPVEALIPTPWPRAALALPLALAALLTCIVLVPFRAPAVAQPAGIQNLSEETLALATDNLANAQDTLDALAQDAPPTPEAAQAASILQELQQQLDEGEPLNEADIARASRALDETADELDARAQDTRESFDELLDAFAGLRDQPEPDETSPLRDALSRGQYDRAATELDRILEELEALPEEEALSLRESLDQLTDDLDAVAREDTTPPTAQQPPALPPELPTDQPASDDPPSDDTQQDSSATPEPSPPTDRQEPPTNDTDPTAQDQPDAPTDTAQDQQPEPSTQQPGESQTTDPQDQQQLGEQTQQQSSDQPGTGEQPSQQDTAEQSARDRIEQLRDALQSQPDPQQSDTQQPSTAPQPDQQDATPQEQPGDTPQGDPALQERQDRSPTQQDQTQPGPRSLDRARELVERWQQDQTQAEESQEDAQQLRERARELLESLDDEERQALRERFDELQDKPNEIPLGSLAGDEPQSTTPFERDPKTSQTDPVNARQQGDPSQVLAQWFRDRQSDDPATRQAAQARLRQAARSAQQAADQQPLPPRSRDAVRRYFQRLSELSNQSQTPAPPTADDLQPPPTDK